MWNGSQNTMWNGNAHTELLSTEARTECVKQNKGIQRPPGHATWRRKLHSTLWAIVAAETTKSKNCKSIYQCAGSCGSTHTHNNLYIVAQSGGHASQHTEYWVIPHRWAFAQELFSFTGVSHTKFSNSVKSETICVCHSFLWSTLFIACATQGARTNNNHRAVVERTWTSTEKWTFWWRKCECLSHGNLCGSRGLSPENIHGIAIFFQGFDTSWDITSSSQGRTHQSGSDLHEVFTFPAPVQKGVYWSGFFHNVKTVMQFGYDIEQWLGFFSVSFFQLHIQLRHLNLFLNDLSTNACRNCKKTSRWIMSWQKVFNLNVKVKNQCNASVLDIATVCKFLPNLLKGRDQTFHLRGFTTKFRKSSLPQKDRQSLKSFRWIPVRCKPSTLGLCNQHTYPWYVGFWRGWHQGVCQYPQNTSKEILHES